MSKNLNSSRNVTIAFLLLAVVYFLNLLIWKVFAIGTIFKVLPGVLLLFAIRSGKKFKSRGFVTMAIVFSILGDIAGEFKQIPDAATAALMIQLFLFAVAQVGYTLSFIRYTSINAEPQADGVGLCNNRKLERACKIALLALFTVYALFVLDTLYIPISKHGPVLLTFSVLYILLILLTAYFSVFQRRRHQWYFVLGAILFVFSDSIVGINAFTDPIPYSGVIIMTTYFAAQYLLNISHIKYSIK